MMVSSENITVFEGLRLFTIKEPGPLFSIEKRPQSTTKFLFISLRSNRYIPGSILRYIWGSIFILFSSHFGPTMTSDISLLVKNLEILLTCYTYILFWYSLLSSVLSVIVKLFVSSFMSSKVHSSTSPKARSSISSFFSHIKVEKRRKNHTHMVPSNKTNFDIIFTFWMFNFNYPIF